MILTEEIKAQALEAAKQEMPNEMCAVIAVVKGKKRYFQCKNISDEPTEYFVLDPEEYASIEDKGEIIAVIHSHPKTKPDPSQVDKSSCERSRVPWYIVSPQTGLWGECHPTGKDIPYVGRPFIHGLDDCYSLVRDWYQKELNIKLNDYFRQNEWWYKGENLYLDNFAKEGFREIKEEELRYGDILLMCIVSNVPNHAAIFLEGNIVLHHIQGRLSSRDVYSGYYRKATAKRLRHESR